MGIIVFESQSLDIRGLKSHAYLMMVDPKTILAAMLVHGHTSVYAETD